MIYCADDPALRDVEDKYITGNYGEDAEGEVEAVCDICGEVIYEDEAYYSNGDMNMCSGCHAEFYRVY